jgi:hypothetical protein
MAILADVVQELKESNKTSSLQVDFQVETAAGIEILNGTLASLVGVLTTFAASFPQTIMHGFQDLINSDEKIYNQEKKDNDTREKLKDREGDGEEEKSVPQKIKGSFTEEFSKAKDTKLTDPNGLFGGVIKTMQEISGIAGAFAGNFMKIVGIFKTGLVFLGNSLMGLFSAITLPMVAIAAAIGALVLGVMNFIEDFKGQEGSLTDKIIAGFFGFADGIFKLLTVPLDWIKSLISTIAEFFGFDGAAEVLDSFSFTDIMDGFTDSVRDWVIGLKDKLVEAITSFVPSGILKFFGFDAGGEKEEKSNKRGMEIPRDSEQTYSTMTKSGMQDLTEEEIKQGRKDGTIKRSIAKDQLDRIKEGVDDTDAPTKINPETGKRGREIGAKYGSTTTETRADGATVTTERKPNAMGQAAIDAANEIKKKQQQRGRVIGEAPAAPTKVSTETGKRGRVIGEAPAAPTKVSTETDKRGRVIGEAPAAPVKTVAEKETEKQIVADMQAGATPEEAVEKAMKVRKEGLADGTIKGTGKPIKTAGPKTVSAREGADALDEAEQLQSSIDALKAEMAALGSAFDPENIAKFKEGLDLTTDEGKAEAKGRRDKFIEGQSEFTDKIKVLQAQKDKVMQTVDKAFGGPDTRTVDKAFGGSDGFDAALEGDDDFEDTGSDDDFYSTRETGAKPTKVTGGTVVTGGGFTVKTESAEAKAERESAVAKEKKMFDAEKKAFALLEQQGVIGADEFLDSDDPRMKQVAELAQKIFDGDLKPTAVGGAQEMASLSDNMASANTKMMDNKAESSTASVNAVNVSDSSTTVNSTTVNTAPMPSPMDKSDRSTQGAYRGRKI